MDLIAEPNSAPKPSRSSAIAPSLKRDIALCLIRIFVIFPLTGAVLGAISAALSIVLIYDGHQNRFEDYWFWVTGYGLPFGIMTGFLFSIPIVWCLRRRSYLQILRFMGTGTLIGGATGLIGGPGLSWWAGMFGFWIGYLFLTLAAVPRQNTSDTPRQTAA